MEIGRFEHHVLATGGLDRRDELVGILQRAENRRYRRGHMLACLERRDRQPGVARSVGGDEDGLDRIVLDQLFARRDRRPQRHALARSAHLSGSMSATAATVTFGWSWK